MAFFRNILSNKRADFDMEAGIQLDDMEAGSGSANSFNLDGMSALDRRSTSPFSFPAPNTGPNAALPSFQPTPTQISTISNTNGKRSQNDERINKVRVVEQGSKMITLVCVYFPYFKIYCMGFYRERLESDINDRQSNTKEGLRND
jgi:hypothetical protein